MYAPVVLFVYNREEHSRLVLEALKRNQGAEKNDLFIYSDAAKSENEREAVGKVRKYIRQISSENSFRSVTVIEAKENKGLAKSIIGGVTDVINKYGKVIVLEDDHITAPDFLTYMNSGLDFYEKNTQMVNFWIHLENERFFYVSSRCIYGISCIVLGMGELERQVGKS